MSGKSSNDTNEGRPVRPESESAKAGAAKARAGSDVPPLHEASSNYRSFLGEALERHEQRALAARQKVEAGEYGIADWQRDIFAFGAQLWSDATEATGHLADLSRSRVDRPQS